MLGKFQQREVEQWQKGDRIAEPEPESNNVHSGSVSGTTLEYSMGKGKARDGTKAVVYYKVNNADIFLIVPGLQPHSFDCGRLSATARKFKRWASCSPHFINSRQIFDLLQLPLETANIALDITS